MEIFEHGHWLPLIFVILMGVSILAYVILDGYDLGVGILMAYANEKEKDKMIASIGPFWDANETWLVLSVGILLVAFPKAHGIILTSLYLPVAIMLFGLILRGVAFDFRAKAENEFKQVWDKIFILGSLITSVSQGFMLGMYIVSFEYNFLSVMFSLLTGVCLAAGYAFVGSGWLIMKTETFLQIKAVKWSRYTLWFTALGMLLISITSPLVNMRIFDKWFSFPNFLFLAPIPMLAGATIIFLELFSRKLPKEQDKHCWVPFMGSILLFILGFSGLAYSFFPYIVPDQLTIWDAASSPEALKVILIGVLIVVPFIILYTIYAYRVFWGKVKDLSYY